MLHAGAPVVKIDRAAKIVTSESGVRESYDKLLIATGSRAFIPPIPGVNGTDKRLQSLMIKCNVTHLLAIPRRR